MSYHIEQIASIIGAKRTGTRDSIVTWLLTDSRSLWLPEETLFFALVGQRNNGHRYVEELYTRGVRNFVVTTLPDECHDDANYLQVKDTLQALQSLAEYHRHSFTGPVVGITGSNGKTVVKEWLYQLLCDDRVVTRSPRSYNSQTGVPLSAWLINEHTDIAILEAGISQPGEMRRLRSIVRPTIGVLTNIGGAHQENFASLQEKCLEKLTLFRDCEVVVYNGDDPMITDCMNRMVLSIREIAWSRKDSERPLFISHVSKQDNHTNITYRYLGIKHSYTIPFIDDASIENSFHCLAVCLYLMMEPDVIAERMAHLEPVAMRLEVKEGLRGCTLINDSYNSDLASLAIALDFMARRPDTAGRERMIILSDMDQTGLTERNLYKKVAQLVETRGIQRIIGIGRSITAEASRFSIPHTFYPTTEAFLASDEFQNLSHEVILIKGARRFGFDRIADNLALKVHETILEIDLDAIVDNLNHYRSFLRPGTRIVCMVKAFAYGAGFYEIAKTLQDHQVDYLAVAVADEGEQLRRAGITANILIMNPERTAFKTMFENSLEPEIYSFEMLEEMIHACERAGITCYPIHIKVDTGMSRLGFAPDDMPRLIDRLRHQTAVVPRSVFSHFAGSDSPAFDAFSELQHERFARASSQLREAFGNSLLRHICNSAGIERFPQWHYEMVRLGLGLYGINPIDNSTIHTVATLRTTILQLRDVPPSETVGYSRKGKLSRPSRIAAIPIGYADGLNRHLGNGKGYCLVNGHPAPYVGNICMDVCMIDVTDIDCKVGDSVEIFGPHLPVSQLAEWLDTIPYEVMTGVSSRVKRIYYSNH